MKTVTLAFVFLLLALPLAAGRANAFGTITDDNTKSDGSPKYADPDDKFQRDRDGPTSSKTYRLGDGSSVTFGIQTGIGNGFPTFGRTPDYGFDRPSPVR